MNRTKNAWAHEETRRNRRRRPMRWTRTARRIRKTRKVVAQGELEQNTSLDNIINFSPSLKQMEDELDEEGREGSRLWSWGWLRVSWRLLTLELGRRAAVARGRQQNAPRKQEPNLNTKDIFQTLRSCAYFEYMLLMNVNKLVISKMKRQLYGFSSGSLIR